MYSTSQGAWGIPNKSKYEQKYNNFRFSSPKAATDMGVSSSESHDLTRFYETSTAGFGVLPKITGFYPSSDRIIEINAWTIESGTWRQVIQWINIPPTTSDLNVQPMEQRPQNVGLLHTTHGMKTSPNDDSHQILDV